MDLGLKEVDNLDCRVDIKNIIYSNYEELPQFFKEIISGNIKDGDIISVSGRDSNNVEFNDTIMKMCGIFKTNDLNIIDNLIIHVELFEPIVRINYDGEEIIESFNIPTIGATNNLGYSFYLEDEYITFNIIYYNDMIAF